VKTGRLVEHRDHKGTRAFYAEASPSNRHERKKRRKHKEKKLLKDRNEARGCQKDCGEFENPLRKGRE